jgi:hypothetical protein
MVLDDTTYMIGIVSLTKSRDFSLPFLTVVLVMDLLQVHIVGAMVCDGT